MMVLRPRSVFRWIAVAAAAMLALPGSAFSSVAQPSAAPDKPWRVRLLIRMPMRDGATLAAHVFLPAGPGPFPTLLERTSYGISGPYLLDDATYWARQGYAYVVQDARGRGDSDGTFEYLRNEGADGYDSVEWVARQPWSTGRVGLIGASYGASAIWHAAIARPPSLACMNADMVSIQPFEEIPYQGGAWRLDWGLTWPLSVAGRQWHFNAVLGVNWADVFGKRPVGTLDERAGFPIAMTREMLAHPTYDDWWRAISIEPDDLARVTVPTLAFTGWVDGGVAGTSYLYRGVRAGAGDGDRARHHIVIGPWPHATAWDGGAKRTRVGELDFGQNSLVDARAVKRAFFDHCLAGKTPRFDAPGARLFITGANQWLSARAYPLPGTTETSLWLGNDHRLQNARPARSGSDDYRYDPDDPMPAYVGSTQRPDALVPGEIHFIDHAPLEARDDVVTYTSETLNAPVTAIGPAWIELWVASDAPDTDFVAKLLDVQPDGRALFIGSKAVGVVRARYRQGYDREVPLEPGKPVKLRIALHDIGHRFLPGHRIRIHVSSSAYPWIDANPNTGEPVATATRTRVANQTILHGRAHASRLVLSTVTPRQFAAAAERR